MPKLYKLIITILSKLCLFQKFQIQLGFLLDLISLLLFMYKSSTCWENTLFI